MIRKLRSTKGTSLVSVLVAFLMLMIVLLIFYSAIRFSSKMILQSVDLRKNAEETMEHYYLDAAKDSIVLDAGVLLQSADESQAVSLPIQLRQLENIKYFVVDHEEKNEE